MIVFDVLSVDSPVGDKGDRMRLFLTRKAAGNRTKICSLWVYPEKVCTVEYMPNTKNSLWQAVFKGFREDIAQENVE